MSADTPDFVKAHLVAQPGSLEARIEELLAGVPPLERTRGRSVAEGGAWAGMSRAEVYRAVENGELVAERAAAPERKNGRRAGTRIRLTYLQLARFRARRMNGAQPIEKAAE